MGQVSDFAEQLNELALRLASEQDLRKKDDQEIIDLLNDVCYKMYHSLNNTDNQQWLTNSN